GTVVLKQILFDVEGDKVDLEVVLITQSIVKNLDICLGTNVSSRQVVMSIEVNDSKIQLLWDRKPH
ncbi:MAG: pyruvate/2-oxoglutarate dehydrogenase complex dihydrolipoamide acyltransferase (E2) component, partial [Gammaproteobacteria bacterium]